MEALRTKYYANANQYGLPISLLTSPGHHLLNITTEIKKQDTDCVDFLQLWNHAALKLKMAFVQNLLSDYQ